MKNSLKEININRSKTLISRTPLWMQILAITFFWVFAIGNILVYLNFEELLKNTPILLKYFFLILGLGIALVVLKRKNYLPWIRFVADEHGLYFPINNNFDYRTKWYFLPWSNVLNIRIEHLIGAHKKGIVFELKVAKEDQYKYFENQIKAQEFFDNLTGSKDKSEDLFIIGFILSIEKPEIIAKRLHQLRN